MLSSRKSVYDQAVDPSKAFDHLTHRQLKAKALELAAELDKKNEELKQLNEALALARSHVRTSMRKELSAAETSSKRIAE